MAAAAVTSLKVDPGGSVVWIARLSSGSAWVLVESFSLVATAAEVVGGKPVGVEAWAGHHRQDLAGAGLDRHHGAPDVVAERLESVVRRVLRVGVDGQLDAAALGLPLLSRSITRLTNSRESSPERMEFCGRARCRSGRSTRSSR